MLYTHAAWETGALCLLVFADQPAPNGVIGYVALALGIIMNLGAAAWWWNSGMNLRITQKDAEDSKTRSEEAKTKSEDTRSKVEVLESRINQQETIVNEIRARMGKLDRVDEVVTAVRFIEDAVNKSLVPRAEQERQWRADDNRFVSIENAIKNIHDENRRKRERD